MERGHYLLNHDKTEEGGIEHIWELALNFSQFSCLSSLSAGIRGSEPTISDPAVIFDNYRLNKCEMSPSWSQGG